MARQSSPIPLLYTPHHQRHAPPVEYHHGMVLTYPELPQRIEGIRDHLAKTGLVNVITPDKVIPKEEIYKTHDSGLVNYLEEASGDIRSILLEDTSPFYRMKQDIQPGEAPPADSPELYRYPSVFPRKDLLRPGRLTTKGLHGYYCFDKDAPIGGGTWKAALHSATLAYVGANLLLDGRSQVAYALCRPPGHHASNDMMGGYCYLNNTAIAASRLLEMGNVAIIDLDYHHGNGTQSIFWDEPRVLFGSVHADPDEEYPYFTGYADETGGKAAPNTVINLPLPPGATEAHYLAALEKLLVKVAFFKPSAIVVSMGYDTFEGDPLGTFKLKQESYQRIGAKLADLNLPTLLVQEGGYNVEALPVLAEQLLLGLRSKSS